MFFYNYFYISIEFLQLFLIKNFFYILLDNIFC